MSIVAAQQLAGVTVQLEPLASASAREVARLDVLRSTLPVMGGMSRRPACHSPLDVTLVARSPRSNEVIGTIDAREVAGYDRVSNVTFMFDPRRARRGCAMEAYTLVGPFLFGLGIRVLHHEVLDCNLPMRRILHGAGIPVQATLREHAYIAGRWWDVHVYGLDERDWQAFEHRLRRFLPWHGGRFAALAG